MAPRSAAGFSGRADTRHLCVYPTHRSTALIRVKTDTGLEGIGEAHAPAAPRVVKTIVEDLLRPILIGEDPRSIDVLWERMFSAMRLRSHTQGFTLEAIAGVDIALWDVIGKHYGEPIWRLLGGPYRVQIPLYSSGTPGQTADARREGVHQVLGEGFSVVKTSCGRGTFQDQMDLVRHMSEAVAGKGQLLVDAHGGFDLKDALRFARFLEGLGNVIWFEDALLPEDHEGYRQLTQATTLRIAVGETDCNRYGVRDRLMNKECDLLLPDVCRAGGISETMRIAQLADVFGVSWASHVSTSTAIHLMAGLHVGAATPNCFISEYPSGFAQGPFGNCLFKEPVALEKGHITLNEKPGLGIELDEAAIAELTVM
ncbi:MAG: mandelate racemase/muconate lactonizing enzyme family protein [bacterium]|nr:mandelate racemase/muconate lactonizing enzyme family protein [bacterium]